jgi:hypothetical protein
MTITQIMEQAKTLSVQERRELITLLHASLQEDHAQNKHSILELAGLGREIWAGRDAQEYVNQLRSEWL